jgi:hypothetical protein
VTITRVDTTGAPFSASAPVPIKVQAGTHADIPVSYRPPSVGDDVGAVRVWTDMRREPFQSGITGGAQSAATIVDQWDQSTPKVDMLLPLTSFPLSAVPKDPQAIVVTVNGAISTQWTYDAGPNRIVFPAGAVPPPGAHITARYEPACP